MVQQLTEHCGENLISCLLRSSNKNINLILVGIHINPTNRSESWDNTWIHL